MRLKELRGLPVIDPTSARKLGSVHDYQVDPVNGCLAAIDITPTSGGEAERILATRIRRVGRSAVILTGQGGNVAPAAPTAEDRWLDAATLSGLEVVGDDGNRVGRLLDATFNQDSLEIEAYQLRGGFVQRVRGRPGRIAPVQVQSCSRDLMLVAGRVQDHSRPAALLEQPASVSGRLPLKADDHLSSPTMNQVAEGQASSARSS